MCSKILHWYLCTAWHRSRPNSIHWLKQKVSRSPSSEQMPMSRVQTLSMKLNKWKWLIIRLCTKQSHNPFICYIEAILSCLQHDFKRGQAFLNSKYIAAISACHVGWSGVTPCTHPLVSPLIRGVWGAFALLIYVISLKGLSTTWSAVQGAT